jgi:probable F420-dependent oxidoreductase
MFMATFGVSMFPTDYAIQPVELARAVEERGLESLFFPEHTHIPASRKTPYPGGGDLPKEYLHTHDPFVALGAAAAVTRRIKLATGICLVIERDPIVLAKEVASLDTISGGRAIFGIGRGWNREEMENHGTDYKRRWKVLREKILAMREIWTRENAEFHGEFVNFDPIWSYPKPVQKGGPPVWLGSRGKRSFEQVVEYCDGWMPLFFNAQSLAQEVKTLRDAAQHAGRRFDTIDLALFGAPADEDQARRVLDLGFSHLIFRLPPAPEATVLPVLDSHAKLAAKLRR